MATEFFIRVVIFVVVVENECRYPKLTTQKKKISREIRERLSKTLKNLLHPKS